MKKLFFLLLIIILGIFQLTILDYFKIFTVKADLLLICMVLASLAFEFRWAFILSVFAGIFKDAFAVTGFGLNSLLFGMWSFLIVRLSKEITLDSNVTRGILIFIVTVLHNTITGLIFIYLGNLVPIGIILRIISIGSIYTAAVSPLVLKSIESLNNTFLNADLRESSRPALTYWRDSALS